MFFQIHFEKKKSRRIWLELHHIFSIIEGAFQQTEK